VSRLAGLKAQATARGVTPSRANPVVQPGTPVGLQPATPLSPKRSSVAAGPAGESDHAKLPPESPSETVITSAVPMIGFTR